MFVVYVDTDPGSVVGTELPLSITVVVCGSIVVVTVTKSVDPGIVMVNNEPETVKLGGTIVAVIVVPGPTIVSPGAVTPGAVTVDAGVTTIEPDSVTVDAGTIDIVSDPMTVVLGAVIVAPGAVIVSPEAVTVES